MLEVYKTEEFARWFRKLRDRQARARIQARIDGLEQGHLRTGGDKGSQEKDIEKAKALARQVEL